ncbi:MAG TPA: uroporphyrinogen-III synthase [Chloroflexia bacterium]|nr:uroporphyrinogen-III synthase [Chloroflexia bacterium]
MKAVRTVGAAAAKLPLQGRRIVVTRARKQAGGLVEELRALGAEPLECPAISIAPLEDFAELDAAIARLESYDWVVFTSVNGVEVFASRMPHLGMDAAALCSRRLAAIGPATRSRLEELGCAVAFMPESYVAEAIVEQIGDVRGCRVLLPRADIARKALAEGLRQLGAQVDEVAAYRTVHGDAAAPLAQQLARHAVDAVTFTSSSTVRYTIEGLVQAGLDEHGAVELLNGAAVVCIGPITAATAKACGLNVTAVASTYTTDGLVEALVLLFGGEERS